MRFMMLMLPKGYEKAAPGAMPDAKAVAAMMKYNESLQKAGVLLALDGLHPPSMGARVSFSGGKPKVTKRALHRGDGDSRRLLDDSGEVERRGGMGVALPGCGQ
jgi:YCII-related domain